MRSLAALLLTLAAALAPVARAQPPSPPTPTSPPDDGSTVVSELEVVARPPGPAMWRVRRGGSEVVILGTLSPLPQSLPWDQRRVGKALDGARQLLTPPVAEIGLLDGPGAALQFVRLRALSPLSRRTPPALYARLLAAARVARADPRKLEGWRPAAAGGWLLSDFQRAAGLSMAKPVSTVTRLAKARRVPVRSMLRVNATPLLNGFVRLDEPGQLRCLEAAVDEVDWEAGHAVPAAQAWAAGRLERARAERARSLYADCFEQLPGVRALTERGINEAYGAMNAALAQPGRTVAVVDLRYLDTRNGLLDRLRAAGATVDLPPE